MSVLVAPGDCHLARLHCWHRHHNQLRSGQASCKASAAINITKHSTSTMLCKSSMKDLFDNATNTSPKLPENSDRTHQPRFPGSNGLLDELQILLSLNKMGFSVVQRNPHGSA